MMLPLDSVETAYTVLVTLSVKVAVLRISAVGSVVVVVVVDEEVVVDTVVVVVVVILSGLQSVVSSSAGMPRSKFDILVLGRKGKVSRQV